MHIHYVFFFFLTNRIRKFHEFVNSQIRSLFINSIICLVCSFSCSYDRKEAFMLTDLMSLVLMLCLNIYLDDNLSDKVNLNID